MIKKLGTVKCLDYISDIFAVDKIKQSLNFNIENEEKIKIHSLVVDSRVIKIKLQNCLERLQSNILNILLIIEVRIIIESIKDNSLEAYNTEFITETFLDIPKEIKRDELEYKIYNNSLNVKSFIEEVKISVEDNLTFSLGMLLFTKLNINELKDINLIAKLNTLEENIYSYKEGAELTQETFFIDNNIISCDYKNDFGYILSANNNNKIYKINSGKVEELLVYEEIGELVQILKGPDNTLIVVAINNNCGKLYLYNEGMFELICSNVNENTPVIYIEERNSLIYTSLRCNEIEILKIDIYKKNNTKYEFINNKLVAYLGICNLIKIMQDKEILVVLLNNNEIVLYDLINRTTSRSITKKSDIGLIKEILPLRNGYSFIIKTEKEKVHDLYIVYYEKNVFRNITNNESGVSISSIIDTYNYSKIYISDNSVDGYNIYELNIETLEKNIFIEINADYIRFLN